MGWVIRAMFYKLPKVGETYEFDDGDPFFRPTVTVLETNDGWVKFKRDVGGSIGSLSRASFNGCYKRVK